MVSARACANQFLPYSSSGIAEFGMRTVQADSCLKSEQIDTLLSVRGVRKGGLGGGGYSGPKAQNLRDCHEFIFCSCLSVKIFLAAATPEIYRFFLNLRIYVSDFSLSRTPFPLPLQ